MKGDDTVSGVPSRTEDETLDQVFFALSDPVRRAILVRLDEGPALVSELAAPFDMSLQAVSRHIRVLAEAGLVERERTGRIVQCRLEVGPIYAAAIWMNRYTKYWQTQFETLAALVTETDAEPPADAPLPPAEPEAPLGREKRPSSKPRGTARKKGKAR